jgi:transcriptional regulator of acetoin/glycerol metabolism
LLHRVVLGRELRISEKAMAQLMAYHYPGNIRELRNLLERASLLCDGDEIRSQHLAEEVRDGTFTTIQPPPITSPRKLTQSEMLHEIAATHHGTRDELARKLGMSVRTLYRHLSKIKKEMQGEDKETKSL